LTSLIDDEAKFAELSSALLTQILDAAPLWVETCLQRHGVEDAIASASAIDAWSGDVAPELEQLFNDDVDAQRVNPLAILRRGVKHPTMVLRSAGAPVPKRARFEVDAFPDDVYDLSPASFADFHPDLAEPGLVWGAAKAHVHLRRRREQA
jgi:hypothetical protein